MFDFFNGNGFDIVNLGNDQWLLDIKEFQKYHGTLKEIATFWVSKLGFKVDEISLAIDEMIMNEHNSAHFGAYGTMLFTFNKEVNYERKAS